MTLNNPKFNYGQGKFLKEVIKRSLSKQCQHISLLNINPSNMSLPCPQTLKGAPWCSE